MGVKINVCISLYRKPFSLTAQAEIRLMDGVLNPYPDSGIAGPLTFGTGVPTASHLFLENFHKTKVEVPPENIAKDKFLNRFNFYRLESCWLLDHAGVKLHPSVVVLNGPLDVQRVRPSRRRVLGVTLEVARETLRPEVLLAANV